MVTSDSGATYRFRDFELDVAGYELRRNGRPVRLERQPMDLLILLVEHRSQLVSRNDIITRLWGKDVFVDVETGVHTAIRKIRQALRDSPDAPSFIETVSGKGYRFIAPVDVVPRSVKTRAPQERERTRPTVSKTSNRPNSGWARSRNHGPRPRTGRGGNFRCSSVGGRWVVGLARHGESRVAPHNCRAAVREPEW
jgi:DNA-binding winged helix-turn-helix (wHTH) protein